MSKKLKVIKVKIYVGYDSEEYEGCSPPQFATTDKAFADKWAKEHYSRDVEEFEVEVQL